MMDAMFECPSKKLENFDVTLDYAKATAGKGSSRTDGVCVRRIWSIFVISLKSAGIIG